MIAALVLVAVMQDTTAPRGGVLEPITVRDSAARAAPLARTVLTPPQLTGLRAAASFDEALARVPGVVAQNRGTFSQDSRVIVRGTGARSPFGVRGVTVLLDGVPQTLPDGQANLGQVDPGGLERVEIVRGAAGSWYGNGAGGVLVLTTAGALGAPPSAWARGSMGSWGVSGISASAVAPVGFAGMRISAGELKQDGYRAYSAGLLRQGNALVELPAGRAARVRARVRIADLARAENPGALDSAQLAADPRQANARNVAFRAAKRATEWQGSLDVARALPAGDLSFAVYGSDRALDNPLPSAWVKLDRAAFGARAAGRYTLRGIDLSAGLDVQRQLDDRRNYTNDSGRIGATPTLRQDETVTALGARLGALVPLGGATVAGAGVRLDRVAFEVQDHELADGDASARRTMGAASFTGSLERRQGAWRGWASVGTAFETPTTTELARPGTGGFNVSLQPQRTLQGELGLGWSRRGAAAGVTLYRSLVKDGLVQHEEPTQPGRFYFVNASRTRLTGLEAEATVRAAPWLSLAAAVTVTEHRVVRFPNDSTGITRNLVPGLPRSTGYALAALGHALGPQLELEVVSQGRTWADDGNTAFAPAWSQLHVRAGWRAARWSVFGGARNVTDERVIASVNVNGAFRRFFEPGPGRTWYVGAETRIE